MEEQTLFEKYFRKIARAEKRRSALIGVIVGFAVNFVIAAATWHLSSILWLIVSVLAGAAFGVATGFFVYFLFLRPDEKKVARKLDAQGLEERVITMSELKDDASFIAQKQRSDAFDSIGKLDGKKVVAAVSKVILVFVAVFAVLGVGTTAVDALTVSGVIPSADELFPPPLTPADYVTASYLADEGGEILSTAEEGGGRGEGFEHKVVKGGDAPTIVAIASDGYVFDGWSDGVTTPDRTDLALEEDLFVTAFFFEMDEEEPEEAEEGDAAGGGGGGFGQGSGGETPPDQKGHGVSGGRYEPSNRVYDGNTPYQDVLDDYYDEAMEELSKNPNLTDEQRAMLEAYYKSLKDNADAKTDDEE